MKTWRNLQGLTKTQIFDFLDITLEDKAPEKLSMLLYKINLSSKELEQKKEYFEAICMTKEETEKAYSSIKRLERKIKMLEKHLEAEKDEV